MGTRAGREGARDAPPPSGDVTFLFTDLEGSTVLWERQPVEMEAAVAEHDQRLRVAIEQHGGYIFTTAGDSFAAAFASPLAAVLAAVAAQLSLDQPCGALRLRARMGVHNGVASSREGDYFGAAVNRCARLMAAGHGGQILVSGATAQRLDGEPLDDVGLHDVGEHRLKDLLEPERIFEVRHPGLRSDLRPLRTLSGPGTVLPVQVSTFVGRRVELAEVIGLLAAHRLVTVVGPGGAGKTRLALQTAAESLHEHRDGVRLVDLARVVDPWHVVGAFAAALGVEPEPGFGVTEATAHRIGSQDLLLLVDNCEHVVDEVADTILQLLTVCPNLRVLATSRERLGVQGEAIYRVPSLRLPEHADDAAATDAVRLFAERGALASPGFSVHDGNLDAVLSICRRLDGLPLALELAAARLAVLDPAEIAERLDQRFEFLTVSPRGTVPRHRTLEAAIAWSYDQLTEAEQLLFQRASVFPGSFDLDAAEAVCSGGSLARRDVVDAVGRLVDTSMLVPVRTDGHRRFRLLASMRAYAGEHLDAGGEAELVARRHADHYAARSLAIQADQRAGRLGDALHALALDEDNVRAAFSHCVADGELGTAATIIGALGHMWYSAGAFREGIEWCRVVLGNEPDLPAEILAPALHAYGTMLGSWTDPEAGSKLFQREVALRRSMDDPARLAAALNNLGNVLVDLDRHDEAEASLTEAADLFHQAGEPATLPLASLGWEQLQRGNYQRAAELYRQARTEADSAEDAYGVALSDSMLAQCEHELGRPDVARSLASAALASFHALGVAPGAGTCHLVLARIERDDGATALAARHLLDALVDPEAHWYRSTKFWVVQVAASIIDDDALRVQLGAAAGRHYAHAQERQPAFVFDDLASLPIDPGTDEAGVVAPPLDELLDATRAALTTLAAGR